MKIQRTITPFWFMMCNCILLSSLWQKNWSNSTYVSIIRSKYLFKLIINNIRAVASRPSRLHQGWWRTLSTSVVTVCTDLHFQPDPFSSWLYQSSERNKSAINLNVCCNSRKTLQPLRPNQTCVKGNTINWCPILKYTQPINGIW